jgi:hypothetical protein
LRRRGLFGPTPGGKVTRCQDSARTGTRATISLARPTAGSVLAAAVPWRAWWPSALSV